MSKKHAYDGFEDFFKVATGNSPYPYQKHLSEGSIPSVIKVQTGAGKTEAAILSVWLWRRLNNNNVPRRLVYCLPRRTLVEQTVGRVRTWLQKLDLADRIGIVQFMGGSSNDDFTMYPARECVIVGTQDMLISSALNRAYGQDPYSWPIIFGMLNNDCIWIMDEIQLMENALPTSVQLDAFRRSFGTIGPCQTIWMSATMNQEWLRTVNSLQTDLECRLTDQDYNDSNLDRRRNATKRLHKAQIDVVKGYDRESARYLRGLHQKGTITAIMVNNVKRSQDLYDAFKEEGIDCMLIHSRFRAAERVKMNRQIDKMSESEDKIVITTQVLEAGVDISVRTLVTELAPWSSMVQRFGRCNRNGTLDNADVYWIDIPDETAYNPYDKSEMEEARAELSRLNNGSVAPRHLSDSKKINTFDTVLRNRDILDLFDTTADLSGNYTDASRFVRTIRQRLDVDVFWRNSDKESAPSKDEICSVLIGDLNDLLKKTKTRGRIWNHTDDQWQYISHSDIFPGQTIMLDSATGGYSIARGWDTRYGESVDVVGSPRAINDSHNADHQSMSSRPVTLEDHTAHVLGESRAILDELEYLDDELRNVVIEAVRYHDIGKAHMVFQSTMQKGMTDPVDERKVWAKSQKGSARHSITGFRHEAVSALAYLAHTNQLSDRLNDLTAYLIASHHGKVRLALRNVSRRRHDESYLLGINTNGDRLPKFTSDIVSIDATDLNTDLAQIGMTGSGPSWIERTTSLLEYYGPFRLAYLELLVRASDKLASKKEREGYE